MNRSPKTKEFIPHPLLRNPHLMTLAQQCRFRSHLMKHLPAQRKYFRISSTSTITGICHWQQNRGRHDTVLLIHGLAGSCNSSYMLGTTCKAWQAGFNIIRLDLGLSETGWEPQPLSEPAKGKDICTIIQQLVQEDHLTAIWLVGYSLGGNLALRAAGEKDTHQRFLKGVAAVSPTIDPLHSIQALEQGKNWMYDRFLVQKLKRRVRRQISFWNREPSPHRRFRFRTLRKFIEEYSIREWKYRNTNEFYQEMKVSQILETIHVPTLLLLAQDDPLVPFSSVSKHRLAQNPFLTFLTPPHGGHCSFIQMPQKEEDAFWAENRILEFMGSRQHILKPSWGSAFSRLSRQYSLVPS